MLCSEAIVLCSEAIVLCSEAVVCRTGQAELRVPEEACLPAVVCGSVQAGLCSEGSDLCRSVQAKLRGSGSVSFGRWLTVFYRAT